MTMLSYCRLRLICCILLCPQLFAVVVESNALDNKSVFSIEFGGESSRIFIAKEDAISSLSSQEYITSAYRVVELNIVTQGNALLRIYYSRPLKPGEAQEALNDGLNMPTSSAFRQPLPAAVQAMADKASGAAERLSGTTVIKEYPLATHARTVEYRVKSREELNSLFEELKKHWLKNKAFFKDGKIVDPDEVSDAEEKPRSLGGTRFLVE